MTNFQKIPLRILAFFLGFSIEFLPISQCPSFAADSTYPKTTAQPAASISSIPVVNVPANPALNPATIQPPVQSTEFLGQEPISVSSQVRGGTSGGSTGPSTGPVTTNDTYFNTKGSWKQSFEDLWGLKAVNAPKAWTISKGEKITVAVVDTGVDGTHPDLEGRMWVNQREIAGDGIDNDNNGLPDDVSGWNFVAHNNDTSDDMDHGTHVAGIIAANANNKLGIAGVAPLTTILPVKVCNKWGSCETDAIVKGIRYAVDMGAKVINLSLGSWYRLEFGKVRQAMLDAVNYAKQMGSILVVAAGNDNWKISDYRPASIAGVIAVGSIKYKTGHSAFSNYGPEIDVSAPGEGILSLHSSQGWPDFGTPVKDKRFIVLDGTSMAAPFVAGIVALLVSAFPTITYDEIYERLKKSAKDLGAKGFDPTYGWGMVDAFGALTVNLAKKSASPGTGSVGSLNLGTQLPVPQTTLPNMAQIPSVNSLSPPQSLFGPETPSQFGGRVSLATPVRSSAVQAIIEKIQTAVQRLQAQKNPEQTNSLITLQPSNMAYGQASIMGGERPPAQPPARPGANPPSNSTLINPPPGTPTKLPFPVQFGSPFPQKFDIDKTKWNEALAQAEGIVDPNSTLFQALLSAVGGWGRIKQAALTKIAGLSSSKFWAGNVKVEMEDGYIENYGIMMQSSCTYSVRIGKNIFSVDQRCIDDTADVPPVTKEYHQFVYGLFSAIPPSTVPPASPNNPPGAWETGENLNGCSIDTKFWRDTIEKCPSVMNTPGTVYMAIKRRGGAARTSTRLDEFLKMVHDQTGINPQWVSIPKSAHDSDGDITFFMRWNPAEGSNEAVAQMINEVIRKNPSKLSGMTAYSEWAPEKAK